MGRFPGTEDITLIFEETSSSVESVSLPVESPTPDSLRALGVLDTARSPPRIVSLSCMSIGSSGVLLLAGDGSLDGADGIVGPSKGAMQGKVMQSVTDIVVDRISIVTNTSRRMSNILGIL
mmetsp:Transcript_18187/g.59766  ORF Transcript_18187/g.59766 Transcript_18187/m.59766 type:complete len:121 (-) Transcript_18187:314-676(-)